MRTSLWCHPETHPRSLEILGQSICKAYNVQLHSHNELNVQNTLSDYKDTA